MARLAFYLPCISDIFRLIIAVLCSLLTRGRGSLEYKALGLPHKQSSRCEKDLCYCYGIVAARRLLRYNPNTTLVVYL